MQIYNNSLNRLKNCAWKQKTAVLGAILYALVFVCMLSVHPGSKKFYESFFNIYQIFPPLVAGVCGVLHYFRGHHASPLRRVGWLLIGLAALSFACGQITWTYYESIRGVEVPFPGWADAGYLGTYPCLIIGVIMLFGSMAVAGRARLILDSAIAASGIGMLSWHFVVERLWHQSDVTLWAKIIGVAYPMGDITAIFGVIVLFKTVSANAEIRRSLGFVAVGMAMIAFADTVFTITTLNGTYHTGSWADWGWSFGWMLLGFSFLLPLWWPVQAAESCPSTPAPAPRRGAAFPILLPYVAAFAAFGVVCVHDYNTPPLRQINNATFISGMALILMVVARQVFTLLENQHLAMQVRIINEGLEETVKQRTRQLRALHHLAKAVNTTLDVEKVLTEALSHARRSVDADAAIIRLREVPEDPQSFQRIARHDGFSGKESVLEWIKTLAPCQQLEMLPLPNQGSAQPAGIYLRAPLKWQEQILGTIGFIRWQNGFANAEFEMVESIGLEIGTALKNAQQYRVAVDNADRDAVTGLFNHRAIHQRLDKEFEQAQRLNQPLSVIMMDVDNFKLFNDTYGHPAGDQVLKRVAQGLREGCDKNDQIGRYGGDEFIILLPGTPAGEAKILAETLRDRIKIEGFRKSGEERVVPISLSFGIADYPNDGTNRHELLTNADTNLYAAKESDDGIGMTSESQHTNRQLRGESSFGILDAMVTAVDNKDRYTRRHSEDVTDFSLWIAEELGLSDETMRDIRVGGLLHDVGKIGVPDEILRKPGRLTAEEYEIMKRHPRLGALIVGALPGMESVLDAIQFHHERWDGEGYPDALEGEDIPLIGRILAVADAFSAMTTTRPYRKGMDWDDALVQIRANIGTQFDPALAHAFLQAVGKRQAQNEDLPLLRAA